MKKGNLNNGSFLHEAKLSPVLVAYHNSDHKPSSIAGHLRFFYSTSPLELVVDGQPQFLAERTAIKVQPGTQIDFNMPANASVYGMDVLEDEKKILDRAAAENKDFFSSLEGPYKTEWDSVSEKELGYIVATERNVQHIIQQPGVMIAPPHSRFKSNAPNGWHFMYLRGSRAFGVGSDVEFQMRAAESFHFHKITTEIYLCIAGSTEITINGERHVLRANDILVAEPREIHARTALLEKPYVAITMQLPSLAGDRFDPENKVTYNPDYHPKR